MRVATLNLLHGVPMRDRVARGRAAAEQPAHEPGTTGTAAHEPGTTGTAAGVPGPTPAGVGPAAADPQDGTAPGTAPGAAPEESAIVGQTERHLWSPDVPDPHDLVRAIEELLETGPIDVIALQEVDRGQPRTAAVDQARIVAEVIGATHWRFVPSIRGIPGIASEGAAWVPATAEDDLPAEVSEPLPNDPVPSGARYGVALISRLPVRAWRVVRFPPAPVSLPLMAPTTSGRPRAVKVPDEPRTAVCATIEAPTADITVATAHLSFVPGVNARQLGEVKAFLAGQPRPMIMLGDFNTPGGIPGLVTGWHQVARLPTYPVFKPRVQFDHIMADGWTPEALEHARASASAIPLAVSDHCALVAEFPDP